MPQKRKKNGIGRTVGLIFLAFASLALIIKALMHGHNIALFNSKGMIAYDERNLIIFTAVVLLSVALPTLFVLFFTAWRYRESNSKATHNPNAVHNKLLVPAIWLIPTACMLVLALVMWPATHRLEPQKQIDESVEPLTIQVVSTRWKWLFIYPEQNIATVNFVQLPVNTPVEFELTADDAPMSSFWIPNLSGQLYTMTGMVNRLNLMATVAGDYPGSSAEINGAGFAEMKFTARASSRADFDQWVQQTKQSPKVLDAAAYSALLKPSENNPPAFYAATESGLYDTVVMRYMGPSDGHPNHSHGHHE